MAAMRHLFYCRELLLAVVAAAAIATNSVTASVTARGPAAEAIGGWRRSSAPSSPSSLSRAQSGRGRPVGASAQSSYASDFTFLPGMPAQPFSLRTLNGTISFPGETFLNKSVVFHVYDPRSVFCRCLWTTDSSLDALVNDRSADAHYVFIPNAPDSFAAYKLAAWMQERLLSRLAAHGGDQAAAQDNVAERWHFVSAPYDGLGNWIPAVLKQWTCQDHNCGIAQIVFENREAWPVPMYLSRLDARYDWLPNPESAGPSDTYTAVHIDDACSEIDPSVSGQAVIVPSSSNCSYFQMVKNLSAAGAATAIIVAGIDEPIIDMNCAGDECSVPLSIPASMIAYDHGIFQSGVPYNVTYQTSPSDNFFFAIDSRGNMAEVGWFLYPSFQFLVWQAQWFGYVDALSMRLSVPATVVNVFNNSAVTGENGTSAIVSIPSATELEQYERFELDLALSCPGTRDQDCYHWDRVAQVFVCCSSQSPTCDAELGRWITPFRRRIGRWLTDVTPLIKLLDSDSGTCTFRMQITSWEVWISTLNLRFIPAQTGAHNSTYKPAQVNLLFYPGATFDVTYNLHWKPYQYTLPPTTKKVLITAVITGHGSDENGCGEFCVTTHHFVVNGRDHNITFSDAGTALGCADHVRDGVLPNEHGTWLYGRDGWCDGQAVSPWIVDVTDDVLLTGRRSTSSVQHRPDTKPLIGQIEYFGFFNGSNPNPKQNPGNMIVYSYLTIYM